MDRIHLVGDVMIGRSFNSLFASNPSFNIWGNTLNIFRAGDILIGNLETTITDSDDPWPNKAFNYKLSPKYASILNSIGFNFLSLANNHILDFKKEGLVDTLNSLNSLNIPFAGAGLNISSAVQPRILNLSSGLQLHIFSAADHYDYWAAERNKEGIWWFNLREPSNLIQVLEEYGRGLTSKDVLMVCLHWGPNWEKQVSFEKRSLARRLAGIGVRIIMGTSAHHVQPFERIGESIVFYSLGDFIDDYAVDSNFRNDIGMIASLDLDVNGKIVGVSITPTRISNLQVNVLT